MFSIFVSNIQNILFKMLNATVNYKKTYKRIFFLKPCESSKNTLRIFQTAQAHTKNRIKINQPFYTSKIFIMQLTSLTTTGKTFNKSANLNKRANAQLRECTNAKIFGAP